jgi:hypothetical protein
MKKAMMLSLLALAAGAAQAGNYAVLQESDCPLVSAQELAAMVRKVGGSNGLDLPKDMAVRAELHCTAGTGKGARYVYSFRAAIERQLSDGEHQRWTPVSHLTGYGTTTGSAPLMRQVSFTMRDLIRQEP